MVTVLDTNQVEDNEKSLDSNIPKRKFAKNYLVVVLDMFRYGESYDHSDYYTHEEAFYVAKKIILSSFSKTGKDGYDEWMMFGEDAIIVAINGAPKAPHFSGQAFVKEVCGLIE